MSSRTWRLGLKAGDVAISGSDAYADYRDQLLPWSDCGPMVADYFSQLSIPSDAHEFVAGLRARLAETAERVDAGFSTNADVGINPRGEGVLKRRPRSSPSLSAQALEAALLDRMPARRFRLSRRLPTQPTEAAAGVRAVSASRMARAVKACGPGGWEH